MRGADYIPTKIFDIPEVLIRESTSIFRHAINYDDSSGFQSALHGF